MFHPLPPGTPWFVTLPDSGSIANTVAPLTSQAPRCLRYRSGRPWLLGDWPNDGVVVAAAGNSSLALIGCCPATVARLTRTLARVRDVAALDVLASSLPGSFHLVAEIDGRRRIQGTASGMRRIFYTVMDGQVIAGDRADVLAGIVASELDIRAVALSLLDPMAPYPLDDQPMWQAVEALPPDRFLLVGSDGRPSRIRWWQQPEPVLSLAEGARLLRSALTEAVHARTGAGGTVSCDLSGGLDSTSLCFLAARSLLAARNPATLVAYTGIGRDPGDDDLEWARLAMDDLPKAVHEILPRDELPLVYDGITDSDERLDRPFIGIIDRAKMLAGFRRLAPHDPRVHLTGLGGDEVVEGAPNYLPSVMRTRPWTAIDRLRGFRVQDRWPLLTSLWMLRPRSYRAYLSDIAARVIGARPMPGLPDLDWADAPRLPPWITPQTVALVRQAFDAVLDSAGPLAGTRDQHCDLLSIRSAAGAARLFGYLAAPTGVPLAAPFVDDRVVEASLAVRPDDRTTPWEYKPLLKEAMRAIVPTRSLGRITKAEGSTEEEAGLDANHGQLLALCDDSRLVDLGLVDAEKLRAGCRYSHAPSRAHEPLQQTFSCEVWLRVLTQEQSTGVHSSISSQG
ncbi:lasso peptide isopeptide bond-forming cyclase [Protofrankia symbiont of Coriaria ruscifolia]|uniref:lasso peptide isopeptide bond-forming cyclase n=1 Tax=Protofrankia symbiont of Coriaria ruscifolia TaxID=1306542 RepID=UPI00104134C5|nr:lasso peptide isopeptide bond-forming cyclase [Protofrankia symbiont of Coriaria ruscifolia]